MIIEQELRAEIARALQGDISFEALYLWVMARSWNMHKDSFPAAVELAANVEALFFDLASGEINRGELRSGLLRLVHPAYVRITIVESNKHRPFVSGSASTHSRPAHPLALTA